MNEAHDLHGEKEMKDSLGRKIPKADETSYKAALKQPGVGTFTKEEIAREAARKILIAIGLGIQVGKEAEYYSKEIPAMILSAIERALVECVETEKWTADDVMRIWARCDGLDHSVKYAERHHLHKLWQSIADAHNASLPTAKDLGNETPTPMGVVSEQTGDWLDRKIEESEDAHANAAFLDWHYETEGQTILGLDISQGKASRKQGWDAAINYARKRWSRSEPGSVILASKAPTHDGDKKKSVVGPTKKQKQ